MKHSERIKLANEISKKLVRKYGKNIISVGIFGSVARNEDDEFSDLELIAITRKGEFSNQYIHKDIGILEYGLSVKNASEMIKKGDIEWSLQLSKLVHQKVIYGDKSIVKKFEKEASLVNKKDLEKSATKMLVLMYDNLSKIKNADRIKSRGKILVPLAFYTIQTNLFVALLNKHIFKRQYFGSLRETKNLKKLPKDYYKLMKTLYESTNLGKICKASIELYNNCLELLKS